MSKENPATCHDEKTEFSICGLTVRPMLFDLDSVIDGHTHGYDHLMINVSSRERIEGSYLDGEPAFDVILETGDYYPVQKNIKHKITDLTPSREEVLAKLDTLTPEQIKELLVQHYTRKAKHYCIFPDRLPNGTIAGENTGWFKGTI